MNEVTPAKVVSPGLYVSLVAAQSEMGNAMKDKSNPHYKSKYADLASVREAVLPVLNKHGIALMQPFVQGELGNSVKTIFIHAESGTSVECDVPLIIGKNDMQGLGAAVTYARRYGLMMMAGIAPDEDDDGNTTQQTSPLGAPIADAWKQGVLDGLPVNASARDTAEGFALAICEGLRSKNGIKALDNEWERRKRLTEEMANRFPDLHEKIVDAYEMRSNDLRPDGAG